MRILIAFICFLINASLFSSTYFVAPVAAVPSANDSNPGTINAPWATWQKAFSSAMSGDTVYFRGGVYYTSSVVQATNSGTEFSPIVFMNFPGETPVLDGISKVSQSHGLLLDNLNNIIIKGLIIRNNRQIVADDDPSGIVISNCSNVTVENCASHNNGKRGFYIFKSDKVLLVHCDSYNNADTLQTINPGSGGDGFIVADDNSVSDTLFNVVLSGCRSWNNSGNGFNMFSEGFVGAYNCWSWNNGYMNGVGYGFTLGPKDIPTSTITRRIERSVAAYNKSDGFTTSDNNSYSRMMQVFNNTSFRNGINPDTAAVAYGFYIYIADLDNLSQNLTRVFKNNLAYDNYSGDAFAESPIWYTHEYNSWDSPLSVTVSAGDFISLDSTGLSGPRQVDGSLPDISFLKLSLASQLIETGTVVPGISYNGVAPDLGAFESGSQSAANNFPYVVITSPACGEIFAEPASIIVSANAVDLDGIITKVEFFSDNLKIGEVFSQPWSFIWNNIQAGTYYLSAVATDNEGVSVPSSSVMVRVVDTVGFGFQIFPNPNNGYMTIFLKKPLPEAAELYLYDFKGVTVFHDKLMEYEIVKQIALPVLPGGLYIFRIYINNKPYYYKIVLH